LLHEEDVSLDKLLELCVPLIGVLQQDIYFSVVGYELGESNGQKRSEPNSQGVTVFLRLARTDRRHWFTTYIFTVFLGFMCE
jgi:hypothetical protein